MIYRPFDADVQKIEQDKSTYHDWIARITRKEVTLTTDPRGSRKATFYVCPYEWERLVELNDQFISERGSLVIRMFKFFGGHLLWYTIYLTVTDTPIQLVRHGDWGWFLETKDKSVFKLVSYTWRHRIRLWIGLVGRVGGDGNYYFDPWRTKFRDRVHNFLNWML